MARNRPKGNGPHMVTEHKIYSNIDFDCKYFGDNFSCNYNGGRCNMKWARANCKFYEGERPKLKKVTKINSTTKIKENISISKGITKNKKNQRTGTISKQPKIIKQSVLLNVGKYIVDSKHGVGKIMKADMEYYYVDFNDCDNVKKKYTFDKINKVFTTYNDAKQVIGSKASDFNIKVNDFIDISNKQFKIKAITKINIILSDGTVIPIKDTNFSLIKKVNNTCVYKKI